MIPISDYTTQPPGISPTTDHGAQLYSAVVFTISLFGCCTTLLGAITVLNHRDMKNTFGRLCFLEVSCAGILLFLHATWVVPVLYFRIPIVDYVDTFLATLVFFIAETQIGLIFSCAVNRYLAVTHSLQYYTDDHRRFKNRFFIFGYALISIIPFTFENCRPFLNRDIYFFTLRTKDCTILHSRIFIQGIPAVLLCIHAVLDILTFVKLTRTDRDPFMHQIHTQYSISKQKKVKKHIHLQYKFTYQALISTFLRLAMVSVILFITSKYGDPKRNLWIASVAYVTYNALDGLVMIVFNMNDTHSSRGSPTHSTIRTAVSGRRPSDVTHPLHVHHERTLYASKSLDVPVGI